MKLDLETIPPVPVEPVYKLTLNLSKQELVWFKSLMGSVVGNGQVRKFFDDIFYAVKGINADDTLFETLAEISKNPSPSKP